METNGLVGPGAVGSGSGHKPGDQPGWWPGVEYPDKAATRPAQRLCTVCGDSASGVFFGALICLPCKSFYIRCTKDTPKPKFQCVASGNCTVDKANRLKCQSCRYNKCQEQGMCRKEKPLVIQPARGQELCRVCGDIANGIHFGAFSCEGCKKFFRRGLKEADTYECKVGQNCPVNPRSRNSCRFCRYKRCLDVGMAREAIRMGRPKKTQFKHKVVRGSVPGPGSVKKLPPSFSNGTPPPAQGATAMFSTPGPLTSPAANPPDPNHWGTYRSSDTNSQVSLPTFGNTYQIFPNQATPETTGEPSLPVVRPLVERSAPRHAMAALTQSVSGTSPPGNRHQFPDSSAVNHADSPYPRDTSAEDVLVEVWDTGNSASSLRNMEIEWDAEEFLKLLRNTEVPAVSAQELHSVLEETSHNRRFHNLYQSQGASWAAGRQDPSPPTENYLTDGHTLTEHVLETNVAINFQHEAEYALQEKSRVKNDFRNTADSCCVDNCACLVKERERKLSPKQLRPGDGSIDIDVNSISELSSHHHNLMGLLQHGYERMAAECDERKQNKPRIRTSSWKDVVKQRIINNLRATILFTHSIPGFSGLTTTDQFYLCRYGGFHMMIILASREQFDRDTGKFRYFWSTELREGEPGFSIRQQLLRYGRQIHGMGLDVKEAACLGALAIMAADKSANVNHKRISSMKAPIEDAFYAYVIEKHGRAPGLSRLRELMGYMPGLRRVALEHAEYTRKLTFEFDRQEIAGLISNININK